MWKGWIWRYWLGRLWRTVVFVTFVCLLCIGTTAYIVNAYVQALLGKFGVNLEESPFSAAKVWKSFRDFQIHLKSSDAPSDAETGDGEVSGAGAGLAKESGAAPADGREAESARDAGGNADPAQEVPRESGEAEGGVLDAWAEQRQKAYGLLLGRLTAEQLDRLAALLEDGLTGEEAAELESLLRGLFTEEEWKQILQILEPLDDRFRTF